MTTTIQLCPQEKTSSFLLLVVHRENLIRDGTKPSQQCGDEPSATLPCQDHNSSSSWPYVQEHGSSLCYSSSPQPKPYLLITAPWP
ncbi:unnamed protein product [Prunus brigantina]